MHLIWLSSNTFLIIKNWLFILDSILAVRRLHVRLALLASSPAAFQPRHPRIHKLDGRRRGHRDAQILRVGDTKRVRSRAAYLHHASEERCCQRAHTIWDRQHDVQGDSEEDICGRGDGGRSSGFCPPMLERSCLPRCCVEHHGPSSSGVELSSRVSVCVCTHRYRTYAHIVGCECQFVHLFSLGDSFHLIN